MSDEENGDMPPTQTGGDDAIETPDTQVRYEDIYGDMVAYVGGAPIYGFEKARRQRGGNQDIL